MNIVQFGQTNSHTHAKVIFVVENFNNKKKQNKTLFFLSLSHPPIRTLFIFQYPLTKKRKKWTHPPTQIWSFEVGIAVRPNST